MQHWLSNFENFSHLLPSAISMIYLMVFLIFYFYFEEILPYFYLPLLDTKLPEDKDVVLPCVSTSTVPEQINNYLCS